jgi:outer membrane biosynthesis protein TonB
VKQNKSFQIPQEKTKAKHKTQNTKQKNTQNTKPTMPEKKKTQSKFKKEEELTKISSVDPERKKEKEKEKITAQRSERDRERAARVGGKRAERLCAKHAPTLTWRRLQAFLSHREAGTFQPPDSPSHQINGHKCDKTE